MRPLSDEAVVEGLRAGHSEAFEQAYERYKADVLALVTTILGRQDGALDVLHDVFVSLARAAPQLSPSTNLKGYLLTASANRARNYLARQRNEKSDRQDAVPMPQNAPADPSSLAAGAEEASRLWQAVASLPDEQRIVVALRIAGGLTFRQIGDREGVSENTARSRYRYALERLRQLLPGGGP